MTPTEKAKNIYNRFHSLLLLSSGLAPGQKQYAETLRGYDELGKLISDSALHIHDQAKQCAVACVNEIMKVDPINPSSGINAMNYWHEVKNEIYKL